MSLTSWDLLSLNLWVTPRDSVSETDKSITTTTTHFNNSFTPQITFNHLTNTMCLVHFIYLFLQRPYLYSLYFIYINLYFYVLLVFSVNCMHRGSDRNTISILCMNVLYMWKKLTIKQTLTWQFGNFTILWFLLMITWIFKIIFTFFLFNFFINIYILSIFFFNLFLLFFLFILLNF